jgi:hypothetical protein
MRDIMRIVYATVKYRPVSAHNAYSNWKVIVQLYCISRARAQNRYFITSYCCSLLVAVTLVLESMSNERSKLSRESR